MEMVKVCDYIHSTPSCPEEQEQSNKPHCYPLLFFFFFWYTLKGKRVQREELLLLFSESWTISRTRGFFQKCRLWPRKVGQREIVCSLFCNASLLKKKILNRADYGSQKIKRLYKAFFKTFPEAQEFCWLLHRKKATVSDSITTITSRWEIQVEEAISGYPQRHFDHRRHYYSYYSSPLFFSSFSNVAVFKICS